MARRKCFEHHEIEHVITVKELMAALELIESASPGAVVTIRQCNGTDFPPFISIESKLFYEKQKIDNSGFDELF